MRFWIDWNNVVERAFRGLSLLLVLLVGLAACGFAACAAVYAWLHAVRTFLYLTVGG